MTCLSEELITYNYTKGDPIMNLILPISKVGSGLIKCKDCIHAKECKSLIDSKFKELNICTFSSVIIREKEVNIYKIIKGNNE